MNCKPAPNYRVSKKINPVRIGNANRIFLLTRKNVNLAKKTAATVRRCRPRRNRRFRPFGELSRPFAGPIPCCRKNFKQALDIAGEAPYTPSHTARGRDDG
ncbi:hypothetical protein NOF55_21910 [Rhizobiaceae bacterium BDR2-2]|uniref:Uncharacterized protein n=1 Tax=Ectorhizobium quercum TaxID=2965071 RepID=A0AAE3N2Q7_9HYPH|nr:hypothetical protein [Ectorhizobium quercum]MCX8999763.1 hypothetical protein [Ectorhizobium quercum]